MPRDPMDDTPEEMAADPKWAIIETAADALEKEFEADPELLFDNMNVDEICRVIADYARTVAERVAQEEYEQERE